MNSIATQELPINRQINKKETTRKGKYRSTDNTKIGIIEEKLIEKMTFPDERNK